MLVPAARRARAHTLFVHPKGVWAWPPQEAAQPHEYADLGAWCTAHADSAARLIVSDQLTQTMVVEPHLPLRDTNALRTYAGRQFVHYYGSAAHDWPLALWQRPGRGACALHSLDLDALRREGALHRVRWLGMSPAWAAALQFAAPALADLASGERAGLLWVEGAHVTCLALEDGKVAQLRQRYMDGVSMDHLATLLSSCVEELQLTGPTFVAGWDIEGTHHAHALPATILGRLDARLPALETLAAGSKSRRWQAWA